MKSLKNVSKEDFKIPQTIEQLPVGDCPGDKVSVCDQQITNANILFELLADKIQTLQKEKVVIGIYGGSGSGKSGMASLMNYYFDANNIKAYRMSGDNYPRRIPQYNDAERRQVFRQSALNGLIKSGGYTVERFEIIQELQRNNDDSNLTHIATHPWMEAYVEGGKEGLRGYLGTPNELDFKEVQSIIDAFKAGVSPVYMKRMGREETQMWYEGIDVSQTPVLLLEWTHANSEHLQGVDIVVLLNSTPEETLERRRARNRGDEIDTPFVKIVLEIEQKLLDSQAKPETIIMATNGDLLDYTTYLKVMNKEEEDILLEKLYKNL